MTLTSDSWDHRIRRAQDLVRKTPATKEILTFYAKLLEAQRQIEEFLRSRREWLPSGVLANDLPVLRDCLPAFLHEIEAHGPAALAEEARGLLSAPNGMIEEILLTYWQAPSDTQFFAKALLQPYARWLAESGGQPVDRSFDSQENRCPFCGGLPQVSLLQTTEATSESGNRHLICATCLTNWTFRRVVCGHCGEERPFKLGYFHTREYEHVRVEACDTCKHYIKGVDLTLFGLASPIVDEVAAAALDVWAQEHGYTKIELKFIGQKELKMSIPQTMQIQEISAHPGPVPGRGTQRAVEVCKYIDVTTCIGCKACEVACVEWNDHPFRETSFDNTYQTMPSTEWNYWNLIKFAEKEQDDGNLMWLMRKDQCMHCEDPGCLRACPADGAIIKYENGIVDFQHARDHGKPKGQ